MKNPIFSNLPYSAFKDPLAGQSGGFLRQAAIKAINEALRASWRRFFPVVVAEHPRFGTWGGVA